MSAAALSIGDRVPTFVRNLNALAEAAGMRVRLETEPYEGETEVRLWSVWEGSKAQFASLQLFTPRQLMLLPIGAYRTKGTPISVPSLGYTPESSLLAGSMHCDRESVIWHIDSGAWPCTIEQRDELEIVTYPAAVTYWGTPEALASFGIDRKRLPLGKFGGKRQWGYPDDQLWWAARRHPDGTVRYHIETEERMRQRQQERKRWLKENGYEENAQPPPEGTRPTRPEAPRSRPDWLRLVVDNTRVRP
jgi:hypothetical protein